MSRKEGQRKGIKTLNKPKVSLVDLETTANQGFYWGQNYETGIIETTDYWKILSYAVKWLDSKKTIVRGWIDTKDEFGLVKELWKLLDEADCVVAHNGKKFDIKKCNAKFAFYHLGPPSPYKVIDTLTEARKYLSLPSYRLNDIADYFGLGHKIEHEGWPLWKRCIAGEPKAWAKMKRYNKHDVILLEKLYLELRPFMATHPQLGHFFGTACPKCGGDLQSRGFEYTKVGKYRKFSCKSCGGWGRAKQNLNEVNLITNI